MRYPQTKIYLQSCQQPAAFRRCFSCGRHNNRSPFADANGKEYPERNKVRITVFNTGENISKENLSRVWNRFFKADEARNREDGGSGIGLSIVRAIMNNYGNDFGVENKDNGVEFYFEADMKEIEKQAQKITILDNSREQAVLDLARQNIKNSAYQETIINTFKDIMKNSRLYQRENREQ